VKGEVAEEARRVKEAAVGDLLIFGHTQLAETLMRAGLVDLLDISVLSYAVSRPAGNEG